VPNPTIQPELRALRARWVFPVTGAPIRDGLVTIRGRSIVAVGTDTRASAIDDLGSAALLPGLVNAHTHLELSDWPDSQRKPAETFIAWLDQVIEFRRRLAEKPRRPVEAGLRESAACGTTALGEIAQPGASLSPFQNASLEATLFLELIAPTRGRVGPMLEAAGEFLVSADAARGWRVGLSPHAPYTVHPELLWAAVRRSAADRVPIAMHLAESREEIELLRSKTGPFPHFLRQLGAWDPSSFLPNGRPLDYLEALAQAHRALVIHGNYLDDEEIAWLGGHADRMAVVYCPRTHAHFGHREYPLAPLLSSGVPVALGTDSRASSPDLSVLAEMRFVARKHPSVRPATVLELGTLGGARALGRDHRFGSLEPGKDADLTAIALPDRHAPDPHELLFDSDLPVAATWHRGLRIEDR
jgi:cytosine/adenosine deaminase-related metal-dependent hydrolase